MDNDSLEDLLKQNIVRILNGREITLGRYPNPPHRIGWVWKDTGLPPTEEEVKVKRKGKNNA
jgi:ABC-type enterochelin transport system substrate-binding protein